MKKFTLILFLTKCTILTSQVFPDRVYFLNNLNLIAQDFRVDSVSISNENSIINQNDLNQWLQISKFNNENNILKFYFNSYELLDSFKSLFEYSASIYDCNNNQTYMKINLIGFENCRFKLEKKFKTIIDSSNKYISIVSSDSLYFRIIKFNDDSIVDLITTHKLSPSDSSFKFFGDPVLNPCSSEYHNFFGWHSPGYKEKKVTFLENGRRTKELITNFHNSNILQIEYFYNKNYRLSMLRYSVITNGTEKTLMTKKIFYNNDSSIQAIRIRINDFSINVIKRVNNTQYIENIKFIAKKTHIKRRRFKLIYHFFYK